MRAMAVVVRYVDVQDALNLRTAADQDPIEAFAPQRADQALGVSVGPRCPNRRSDDIDALASEDIVEHAGELRVPIVDQEASRGGSLGERSSKLTGLLGDPARIWDGAHAGEVNQARRYLDEEENVEPRREDAVNCEEVAGEHALSLGADELAPGESRRVHKVDSAANRTGFTTRPSFRTPQDEAGQRSRLGTASNDVE